MTLDLANAILLLSGLSFLGLGAQPPQAEWGSMVADGTQYFQWWWMGTFPGLAIFTVVLAFNFLGDSLRDVFDPRTGVPRRGERVSLLEVDGLRVRLRGASGLRHRRRRGRLPGRAGRGVRRRRRERQRQDDVDAGAARPAARRRRRSRGRVRFDGRDLLGALAPSQLREISGRELAMVFQDPMTSLHPMLSIGRQLTEHVRRHLGLDRRAAERRALELLEQVRIPDRREALRALPAPVLRRHAPADRDRDRARLPARSC